MNFDRHPGAGRDLAPARHRSRVKPGMTLGLAGLLAFCAAAAIAQGPPPAPKPETKASRPGASGGEALYLEHCASCHAANGMGTGLLARRVEPALLEARDNLTAQFVVLAARQGIGNMPSIPRGEVDDAELKQIADYLAAGPHEAAQGPAR